jgi:hypothetical protein
MYGIKIEEILPEAKSVPGVWGSGKYKYKDWLICLPCGFVHNETTNQRLRFNSLNFEKILLKIK